MNVNDRNSTKIILFGFSILFFLIDRKNWRTTVEGNFTMTIVDTC